MRRRTFLATSLALLGRAAVTQAQPTPRYFIGKSPFPTLAKALAALQDGQILDIASGIHSGECGYTNASNITIRCIGEAIFDTAYAGKSTFVLEGNNVVLRNLSGIGISNAYGNGGLIRFTGENLTASNIRIVGCQTGVLSGNNKPNSVIRIVSLNGNNNGTPGDGQSHAVYVGACAAFYAINISLADTNVGHLLKSRAAKTVISGCRLIEGRASRAVDICNGGVLDISNTYLKQTNETSNREIIGYGAECPKGADGVRLPIYPLNTVSIGADVHCWDTYDSPSNFFSAHLVPTQYTNSATYNKGTDPFINQPVIRRR